MSSTTSEPSPGTDSNSYDDIPYPSHPFEVTHPDHLYGLAKLFGLDPAIPDGASFLELGCASGGNIIPHAVQMPKGRFVGVDLSPKQIEEGQATVKALGLENITLQAEDLKNIDESYGKFDYIVCHGVFSWVPPEIQHRILEICKESLTPNGVAYISYNANPGWFMRGMIRQMMLHHTKNVTAPKEKIQQARAMLSFIVDSTEGQNTPYANVLKQELELLGKHADAYLYHEHLEENNHPMFFYEFMEMAREHNLQFLSESNLASMVTSNLPKKAAEALTKLTTDVHHRSQYTDFVTNRMFRQTLLCHSSAKIDRHINNDKLEGARFAGAFTLNDPKLAGDLGGDVEITFKCSNGRGLTTKNVALKALLFALTDSWPTSLSIEELCAKVDTQLQGLVVVGEAESPAVETLVNVNIMQMLVRGDIEFKYIADRFVGTLSDHPRVSELSRLQAKQKSVLTTQRHTMISPDALTQIVIPELDGTNTKADLVKHMTKLTEEGILKVNIKGGGKADFAAVHGAAIDKVLEQLRKSAILIS